MASNYKRLQEENKLTALRAMAEGNPDPFAGSSSVISGAQDEALSRYAGEAAGRNAPSGSVSQGEALIRSPGDRAIAALGEQGSSYAAALTALQTEAANAAANPASVGGSSGRQMTKEEAQEAAGYKQYGGYNTSEEYNNAVLGRALEMQANKEAEGLMRQAAAENERTESGIAALKAQQAKNEAIVGGPGAVIHGIGWGQTPAPRVETGHDFPQWRQPGDPFYKAPPAPPPPPAAPPPESSNYSPAAVAMLRAAGDQAASQWMRQGGRWDASSAPFEAGQPREATWIPGEIEATWGPRLADVRDPRNLYQFAQDAAVNELGGETYEAMGRFSPEWATKFGEGQMTGVSDYEAAQNEALERQANLDAGLGAYTDQEIRSSHENRVRSDPAYETGMAIVDEQMRALGEGAKTDQPITLDGLRAEMSRAGVPVLVQVQIINDVRAAYPGSSFFEQPQESIEAASTTAARRAAGNNAG